MAASLVALAALPYFFFPREMPKEVGDTHRALEMWAPGAGSRDSSAPRQGKGAVPGFARAGERQPGLSWQLLSGSKREFWECHGNVISGLLAGRDSSSPRAAGEQGREQSCKPGRDTTPSSLSSSPAAAEQNRLGLCRRHFLWAGLLLELLGHAQELELCSSPCSECCHCPPWVLHLEQHPNLPA